MAKSGAAAPELMKTTCMLCGRKNTLSIAMCMHKQAMPAARSAAPNQCATRVGGGGAPGSSVACAPTNARASTTPSSTCAQWLKGLKRSAKNMSLRSCSGTSERPRCSQLASAHATTNARMLAPSSMPFIVGDHTLPDEARSGCSATMQRSHEGTRASQTNSTDTNQLFMSMYMYEGSSGISVCRPVTYTMPLAVARCAMAPKLPSMSGKGLPSVHSLSQNFGTEERNRKIRYDGQRRSTLL
mmetsp:Transcript_59147/g.152097  ORF Transcript_59147/g.152097 Transcript_59147/m.152097 type:complete len:242 (-) Transcript_59147:721-1446(-)